MARVPFRVRFNYERWKRKASVAKSTLPAVAQRELTKLAEQAIELVRNADTGQRQEHAQRQIGKQLASVFVPVQLKHVRPERWPNLQPIYAARIIRGQSKFQGRRLFYVDENKEEALFERLVDAAMKRGKTAKYEVRFSVTYDKRFRVEIIRRDGGNVPPVMLAFARTQIANLGDKTAAETMRRAGLV